MCVCVFVSSYLYYPDKHWLNKATDTTKSLTEDKRWENLSQNAVNLCSVSAWMTRCAGLKWGLDLWLLHYGSAVMSFPQFSSVYGQKLFEAKCIMPAISLQAPKCLENSKALLWRQLGPWEWRQRQSKFRAAQSLNPAHKRPSVLYNKEGNMEGSLWLLLSSTVLLFSVWSSVPLGQPRGSIQVRTTGSHPLIPGHGPGCPQLPPLWPSSSYLQV